MKTMSTTERLNKEIAALKAQLAERTAEADALHVEKATAQAFAGFVGELGYQLANERLALDALRSEARVERGEDGPRVVFIDASDGLSHIKGDGTPQTAQERLADMKGREDLAPLFAPAKGELLRPANFDKLPPLEQLAINRRIMFAQLGGAGLDEEDAPQRPENFADLSPMEQVRFDRAAMLKRMG